MTTSFHQTFIPRCIAASLVLAGASMCHTQAADLSDWVINKHQHFNQTNSGNPGFRYPAIPYEFEAAANSGVQFVITNLTLRLPTGLTVSCYPYATNDNYGYGIATNDHFASEAALDAAYPTGKYVLTITTVNDGVKVVTNTLPPSVYPSAPHISNFDAAQNINPAKDFTLTWDTFAGGTASDFIKLDISDTNGNNIFTTGYPGAAGGLNGLSNSIIIPKNSLPANTTFNANLQFYIIISSDTNSVPGATGRTLFWKWTHFPMQTTNYNRIFPIAINGTVAQAGFSLAFGRSNFLVGIQGDAIIEQDITAQLVSTNGSLIGSRIAIGRTGGNPDVGFDGTNYLLVWPDDALLNLGGTNDQVYGQRVSQTGALVGSPFTFGPTSQNQDFNGQEHLAFDGRNYLIVAQAGPSHDVDNDSIVAWLTTPSGALVVPAMSMSSTSACPSVVFGKTNYLVAWNRKRPTGSELYDIYGEFISTNGTQGSSFVISQTPTPRYNPCCIGFDGTNFLVVWNKDMGPGYPSPQNWNIYGRLVTQTGAFPGSEVAMVTDTNNPIMPFLSFDGTNYLMDWHAGISDSQIYYQFFNPSAVAIGSKFNLFSTQGTNPPLFGSVCYGGGQFAALGIIGGFDGGNWSSNSATYGTFLPSSTAEPRLTATSQFSGAQFPLRLSGTPGINYALQFSTNLPATSWAPFITNSPTNGDYTFSCTNNQATNRNRFYRAVKQ